MASAKISVISETASFDSVNVTVCIVLYYLCTLYAILNHKVILNYNTFEVFVPLSWSLVLNAWYTNSACALLVWRLRFKVKIRLTALPVIRLCSCKFCGAVEMIRLAVPAENSGLVSSIYTVAQNFV